MSDTFLTHATEFCVTDIGSTTTKAILFRQEGKTWRYFRKEAPTTVEKPYEDVTVGVVQALGALERISGATLLKGGKPTVPYLSTSSAGGGLAMVVTGLVRAVTSRSAERVALGAGAILLDIIAMDDGRTPYEKIEALKLHRPDMVLLAGGFDGSALSGPVFLAELIREAGLRPKLSRTAELPVVFAGNAYAREFVKETLGTGFLFCPVPNLRPASDRENLEPAREAIHELFMGHVMSHAPGYERLISLVDAPLLPTPAAFGKILALVSETLGVRVLAVDIGGATTDVFSAVEGSVFRTVSANLGMSYSLLNVVESAGMAALLELLPHRHEEEIWNLIGNKHIRPTSLPGAMPEMEMEWAAAALAIREAVKDHLRVREGFTLSRGKDELGFRHRWGGRRRKEKMRDDMFSLAGYDLIIGSGGILSHSRRDVAAMILINALRPQEPVALAVDSAFMFPHLGVLSTHAPERALALFQELGLVRLGHVVVAEHHGPAGAQALRVRGANAAGQSLDESINFGEIRAIPLSSEETSTVTIEGKGMGRGKRTLRVRGGTCGLLVDARLRPGEKDSSLHEAPDKAALWFHESVPDLPSQDSIPHDHPRIRQGTIIMHRELAIPGTVFVKDGASVESDAVIARSSRQFLRPFFLEVATSLKVSPEQLGPYLLKRIGEEISTGEVIAKRRLSALASKKFISPVEGTIERILPSGTLVVREKPEQAQQLGTATVAKDLRIRPEQMKPYVKVKVGQPVNKGQWVASKMQHGELLFSAAPVRGVVKEINHRYGVVYLESLHEELEIRAWLPGIVDEVSEKGCVIRNEGIEITGIWGCGDEASGLLAFGNSEPERILVRDFATKEDLSAIAADRGAGLITGGLHLKDVRDLEPAYTIVVTEGFGKRCLAPEMRATLEQRDGSLALIDGTTELRVGVKRPRIILPE